MSDVIIVGMTGPTGAGKSTVGKLLRQRGFSIIDADKTARKVTEKGSPVLAALCDAFGDDILSEDGSLIRPALAAKAFVDKESLNKLNSITHPAILSLIEAEIASLTEAGKTKIILDAPQLFEAGAEKFCTFILSVLSDMETRIERIMCRDSISRESAVTRIEAQKSDEFFLSHSDFVVYNNSDEDALIPQIDELMEKLGLKNPNEKPEPPQPQNIIVPQITTKKSGRKPLLIVAIILVAALVITGIALMIFGSNYNEAINKSVAVIKNPSVKTIEEIYPPQVWDYLIKLYSDIDPSIDTAEDVINTYLLDGTNEISGKMYDDFGTDWAIECEVISDEALEEEAISKISADLEKSTGRTMEISKAYNVYLFYTISGADTSDGFLNFTAIKIDGEWYVAKQYAEIGWKLSILEF
ncbi:MAG: dephospho-CoA kinase [Clostridia bacterium]|nr:dephospho-CoA kinase [Clostridia bacterium]